MQFEHHKASLVSDILRPDKNLNERAEYYWQSIFRKEWNFDSRQSLADAVQALRRGHAAYTIEWPLENLLLLP